MQAALLLAPLRPTRLPAKAASAASTTTSSPPQFSPLLGRTQTRLRLTAGHSNLQPVIGPFPGVVRAGFPPSEFPVSPEEEAKLAQVTSRLEKTSRYFKSLGSFSFWSQLICTIVSGVILSFSTVVTGRVTAPFTFYSTAAGIATAFVSVFWSFGYIRLSERLRRTANDPSKAPPRGEVVKSLKNGIMVNLIGMGAAILGMQATVGALVAKALTTSSVPYYQGIAQGQSPVLALDVFLVQASANTILSHFLGLASSLELLRSVTLPNVEPVPTPRTA